MQRDQSRRGREEQQPEHQGYMHGVRGHSKRRQQQQRQAPLGGLDRVFSGGAAAAAAGAHCSGQRAVIGGRHSEAKKWVEKNMGLAGELDRHGKVFCPLTRAAGSSSSMSLEVVQLLLEGGAAVEGVLGVGAPLKAAACKGNIEVVKLLMQNGANVRELIRRDHSLLSAACGQGSSAEVVEILVQHGAAVDGGPDKELSSERPLVVAAKAGSWASMGILLGHGAAVWWQGMKRSLLGPAVRGDALEIVAKILARGIPAAADTKYLAAPLSDAVIRANMSAVKQLLQAISKTLWLEDDKVRCVFTSLLLAAAGCHLGMVKLLLAAVPAAAGYKNGSDGWGPVEAAVTGTTNARAAAAEYAARDVSNAAIDWCPADEYEAFLESSAARISVRTGNSFKTRAAIVATLLRRGAPASALTQGLEARSEGSEDLSLKGWFYSFARARSGHMEGASRKWLGRALLLAAADGNLGFAKQLVATGAKVKYSEAPGFWSPLHAAACGHPTLEKAAAAIANHKAAAKTKAAKRATVISFLLEFGADPSSFCVGEGLAGTALYVARRTSGSSGVVSALLSPQGRAAKSQDEKGSATALLLATERGDLGAVMLLVGRGDGGTKVCRWVDNRVGGERALQVAARQGHTKIVQVLLQMGAVLEDSGDGDATPLQLAAELAAEHPQVLKTFSLSARFGGDLGDPWWLG